MFVALFETFVTVILFLNFFIVIIYKEGFFDNFLTEKKTKLQRGGLQLNKKLLNLLEIKYQKQICRNIFHKCNFVSKYKAQDFSHATLDSPKYEYTVEPR